MAELTATRTVAKDAVLSQPLDAARWQELGEDLAAGQKTLVDLWGDTDRVHMAVTGPDHPGIRVVSLRHGADADIPRGALCRASLRTSRAQPRGDDAHWPPRQPPTRAGAAGPPVAGTAASSTAHRTPLRGGGSRGHTPGSPSSRWHHSVEPWPVRSAGVVVEGRV